MCGHATDLLILAVSPPTGAVSTRSLFRGRTSLAASSSSPLPVVDLKEY